MTMCDQPFRESAFCQEVQTWSVQCGACRRMTAAVNEAGICLDCEEQAWLERYTRTLLIQGRQEFRTVVQARRRQVHPFQYDTAAQDGFCTCGKSLHDPIHGTPQV